MTQETNPTYDVCLVSPEPNGRLSRIGTAYPTPIGTGYRFTLKAALGEGAQLLLLPSRSRSEAPQGDVQPPAGEAQA